MKISIVTDEISADLETALELGTEWGIHAFELRGVDGERAPLLSDYQKQRVFELLEEHHAQIIALSPGLFKFPFPPKQREHFSLRTFDMALYQKWRDAQSLLRLHLEELLPASLDFARQLGAAQIVIFSFQGGEQLGQPVPDEVLETLAVAARQAEAASLSLAIEVEAGYWADTGQRAADLVRAINSPALGVNWDPGNAFEAGDVPYPNGYQAVRDLVRHVHFKDIRRNRQGQCRYVVKGSVDWASQIQALASDHYAGYISVETHMTPKVKNANAVLKRLKTLLAAQPESIRLSV